METARFYLFPFSCGSVSVARLSFCFVHRLITINIAQLQVGISFDMALESNSSLGVPVSQEGRINPTRLVEHGENVDRCVELLSKVHAGALGARTDIAKLGVELCEVEKKKKDSQT
jgi:hypothetical protein